MNNTNKSVTSIHPFQSVIQTDDIVKAHSGELKVENMEGEGSEFTHHLANTYFLKFFYG